MGVAFISGWDPHEVDALQNSLEKEKAFQASPCHKIWGGGG